MTELYFGWATLNFIYIKIKITNLVKILKTQNLLKIFCCDLSELYFSWATLNFIYIKIKITNLVKILKTQNLLQLFLTALHLSLC